MKPCSAPLLGSRNGALKSKVFNTPTGEALEDEAIFGVGRWVGWWGDGWRGGWDGGMVGGSR